MNKLKLLFSNWMKTNGYVPSNKSLFEHFQIVLYDSLPFFVSLLRKGSHWASQGRRCNNRKIESIPRFFSFPSYPAGLLFPSPQCPYDTKTRPWRREIFLPESKRPSINMITVQVFLKLLNLRKFKVHVFLSITKMKI